MESAFSYPAEGITIGPLFFKFKKRDRISISFS